MKTHSFIRRAVKLVPSEHKRGAFVLILFLVIGSILDLFSLASFIPIVVLAINTTQILPYSFLNKIQTFTGLDNPVHFGIALTLLAISLTLLKSKISTWVIFYKAKYAYGIASDLASQALANFFQIPFKDFSDIDYTKEMNRITNLPLTFANNFIIPLGTIISEGVILIGLVISISIFNFPLFVFLVTMVSPLILLYIIKQKKIQSISEKLKKIYPKLLKYCLQAIEGLPEVRTFRKEHFFKKRFSQAYKDLGKTFATDHATHISSSRATEIVVAICIGTMIVYILLTESSSQESILLLTLYAAASFRMMPSVNRIFAAGLQIRTHEYAVNELIEMACRETELYEGIDQALFFDDKIEVRDLSFCYMDQPYILKNLSLTIQKGEKVLLIGKSGIGKSTFLMLLMQFLNKHEGDILVDSKKITPHNRVSWQKLVGYVPQVPYILDASVLENIAFGIDVENIDVDKIKRIINDLDLKTWISNLPNGLNTIIGEKGAKISGGQRQRLAIARALYHDAEILLLDEITNQLDKGTELEIMRALENLSIENKTIILITHRPELWKFFDSIYELNDGTFEKIKSKTIQARSNYV